MTNGELTPAECTALRVQSDASAQELAQALTSPQATSLTNVSLPVHAAHRHVISALERLPSLQAIRLELVDEREGEDDRLLCSTSPSSSTLSIPPCDSDAHYASLAARLAPLFAVSHVELSCSGGRGAGEEDRDVERVAKGQRYAQALVQALRSGIVRSELETLSLRGCNVGDAGATVLAGALEQNAALKTLDLAHSNIGTAGAEALASALEKNTALAAMDLSGNPIGSAGMDALAHALEHNTVLQSLELPRLGGDVGGSSSGVEEVLSPSPFGATLGQTAKHAAEAVVEQEAPAYDSASRSPIPAATASSDTAIASDTATPLGPGHGAAGAVAASSIAHIEEQRTSATSQMAPAISLGALRASPSSGATTATLRADIADAIAANRAAALCGPDELVENGACVKACSPGHLTLASTRRCVPCHANCASCAVRATNCTSCVAPLLLEDHKCVPSCSPRTVARPADGVCEPCHSECGDAGCHGPSSKNCFACRHFRNEASCVVHCPKGKTPDDVMRCHDSLTSPMRTWLESLRLRKYADLFHREMVTFELLHRFTDEDLRELGIRFSPERDRLRSAVHELLGALPTRFTAMAKRYRLSVPKPTRFAALRRGGSIFLAWAWSAVGGHTAVCKFHTVADVQHALALDVDGRVVRRIVAGASVDVGVVVPGSGESAPLQHAAAGDNAVGAAAAAADVASFVSSTAATLGPQRSALTCRRAWQAMQRLMDKFAPAMFAASNIACESSSAERMAAWALADMVNDLRLTCPRARSGRPTSVWLHDEL